MESSTGDKKCVHDEGDEEERKAKGGREVTRAFVKNDAGTKLLLPSSWRIETELQIMENSAAIGKIEREVRSLSIKSLDNLNPSRDVVVIEKSVQSSPTILRNKKTSTETDECSDTTGGEDFASVSEFEIRRKVNHQTLIAEIPILSKRTDVLLDRLILEAVSAMLIWKKKQRREVIM